jgi:type II secretory pathway pseudopilin PulG
VREWLDKRFGEGQAGLTMVEVLVAAVVLVMGAAATFGVLAAATRNAQRAKATQVALDLAQEEMERLHSIPYDELAVNVMPTTSSNPKNPNSRMSSGSFALKRGNPNKAYFPMDVNAETGFSPASEFFTGDSEHGGVRGTLYRYVVWRNDPSCTTEECEKSEQDYKQIVVAVKPDRAVSQGGESGYVEVQSAVTAPVEHEQTPQEIEEEEKKHEEEEKEKENGGGSGTDVTAQQFFLSDTACSSAGATARAEILGDHLLHNTLGTCASGPQTGSEKLGAPDALLLSGAPDLYPEDETKPALYDYSDDFYLEPTPDTDKGVQIRRDDTAGCHYKPTGTTNPESQVHRWVTDPMPKEFAMGGKATLEFYTRTLNDALYTGRLCVYLFERKDIGNGEEEDTMLIDKENGNPYWTYEPEGNGYWPRNSWAKIRLTMEFQAVPPLAVGHRLGVALSVDRANTPADAIPIMYDHPNYPTRLEVDTKTPLEAPAEEATGG